MLTRRRFLGYAGASAMLAACSPSALSPAPVRLIQCARGGYRAATPGNFTLKSEPPSRLSCQLITSPRSSSISLLSTISATLRWKVLFRSMPTKWKKNSYTALQASIASSQKKCGVFLPTVGDSNMHGLYRGRTLLLKSVPG